MSSVNIVLATQLWHWLAGSLYAQACVRARARVRAYVCVCVCDSACVCVRAREREFAYTRLCINARTNYVHIPTISTSHNVFVTRYV